MKRWWPLRARAAAAPGQGPEGALLDPAGAQNGEARASTGDQADEAESLARLAFSILLWRLPSDGELRESAKALASGQPLHDFTARLIASPEFKLLSRSAGSGGSGDRAPEACEAALASLGPPESFVAWAYRLLFDREADEGGRAHYVERLAEGERRIDVLRALLRSDEFAARRRQVSPGGDFVPRDVQLCELANPAKWDNPDWMAWLRSLQTQPDDKLAMHRKTYEFTQTVFGLDRLGLLHDGVSILSVGAGHESLLYWLANRVRLVVATDLYEGEWQTFGAMEGDQAVLRRPEDFAPFPYRTQRLAFLRMDGRRLAFPARTFDVAYSLSSIEHFGGAAGAVAAIDEMARVLRPGGVLVLATEYILSGPGHHEAFLPDEIRAMIDRPSLTLVEPIDERVYQRYAYVPVDLWKNRYQTPHMVVQDRETQFTTVMMFLRKTE